MKKLLHFNQRGYESKKQDILHDANKLNTAVIAFEALGLGQLTPALFQKLFNEDYFEVEIAKLVKKAMDESKIKIASIRESSISYAITQYRNDIAPIVRQCSILNLKYLELAKGKIEIIQKADDALQESFKNYLEGPETEKLFAELQAAADIINKIGRLTQQITPHHTLKYFFESASDGTLRPNLSINYGALAQLEKQAVPISEDVLATA